MASQCKDCSYQHRGKVPGGRCPACGSYNMSTGNQAQNAENRANKAKSWRLPLSIGLWGWLAFMIYQKFQS